MLITQFQQKHEIFSLSQFLSAILIEAELNKEQIDLRLLQEMEANSNQNVNVEDEEEYVLLDLDAVCGQIDIPPNAPYVLSGLDTMNPVLVIGDKLKLIGDYEETIGTTYVFSETDGGPLVHEETGPSEANLFKGKCIEDPNQASVKQVKPIAGLHKILKFRLVA